MQISELMSLLQTGEGEGFLDCTAGTGWDRDILMMLLINSRLFIPQSVIQILSVDNQDKRNSVPGSRLFVGFREWVSVEVLIRQINESLLK